MDMNLLYGAIGLALNENIASAQTDVLVMVAVVAGWVFYVANFGVLHIVEVRGWRSLLRTIGLSSLAIAPLAAYSCGLLSVAVQVGMTGVSTLLHAYLSGPSWDAMSFEEMYVDDAKLHECLA